MDIIELECPSCGEMLELDAGFAGGVCRCSDCGTLMTVPADPSRERAEALKRPDRPGRPDAPTSLRPARTDDDVEVEVEIEPEPATSQTAIELSASGALDDLSAATADIAAATTSATAAGTLGTETYFTPSGKEVRISRTMVIPTAKKRSSIRAIGISILIGGTAVLFALIVGLVYVLFGNSGGGNVPTRPQVVGLSPDENPLTSEKINFLGMPLRKSTAIVIESYYYNKYWSEPVTAALESVIDKAGTTNTFQVILSTDLGPIPIHPMGRSTSANSRNRK